MTAPIPIKPGDALRDEAAQLLSSRFGEAVTEKRETGKKVDVYFEERKLGKTHRIYVEAKDYAERLSRQEAVTIWTDYSGIIARNRPATLLLITRNGLSTDAQAFVADEQHEMAHQTIRELENETLGLERYVRYLGGIFDEEGLSAYYVDSRAYEVNYDDGADERALSPNSVDIFAELQSWLTETDDKPIAVLGGYLDLINGQMIDYVQRVKMLPSAQEARTVTQRYGTYQFCKAHGLPMRSFNDAMKAVPN